VGLGLSMKSWYDGSGGPDSFPFFFYGQRWRLMVIVCMTVEGTGQRMAGGVA